MTDNDDADANGLASGSLSYTIDGDDNIIHTGGGWDCFAEQNDAPQLVFENICGAPLWDHLEGAAIIQVFQTLIKRVREGKPMEFKFRCDSPQLRRTLSLQMFPHADGSVTFQTRTLHVETRSNGHATQGISEMDRLVVCSWCRKIEVGDDIWTEVEDSVDTLRLFDATVLPEVSHGICETCYATLMSTGSNESTEHSPLFST